MKEKNKLRNYLIGRFLLTLLMVGLCQIIINIVMRAFIIPDLEVRLGLDGLLSGRSISQMLQVFFSCLITIILRAVLGSFNFIDNILEDKIISQIISSDLKSALLAINSRIDDMGLAIYAFIVVLAFLGLLLIWILPYVIGAISYSKKVSKKINELEQERIEREREYEKQRNLLLSDITHDIKTPITTIAGFSQALSDGTIQAEERDTYLKAIYNKSMKVSELIALLFEYIKLDSKGYSLTKTEIDFAELVRECVAGSYTEFEEKEMNIELDVPESQIKIMADKMQLERAINNILSNTIKHNPNGTPVVISLTQDKGKSILEISDKGTRIEKEDALHLFEPFYLADKSRKSGSGNGLGLSITKKIVQMHGGKVFLIQYRDAEKHGCVKTFRIEI